jgi:hypothetical protein
LLIGSDTGLASGRKKCKAATFKNFTAMPTKARSARNIVTLALPWLSIIGFSSINVVALLVSLSDK